jgi:5-methylcytosine-specific restriction protein A
MGDPKDDFVRALDRIFRDRTEAGAPAVEVISGELHRKVGGYPGKGHAMPTCCDVMREAMRFGDEVVATPERGKGATLRIRYALPR